MLKYIVGNNFTEVLPQHIDNRLTKHFCSKNLDNQTLSHIITNILIYEDYQKKNLSESPVAIIFDKNIGKLIENTIYGTEYRFSYLITKNLIKNILMSLPIKQSLFEILSNFGYKHIDINISNYDTWAEIFEK